MRTRLPLPFAAAVLLSLALAASAAPLTLYVDVDAPDGGDGSAIRPFGSLEHARDAIRARRQAGPLPDGGVTVRVRPGLYELGQTLTLDEHDAGTATAPIVYRGDSEPPILVGGRKVTGWQPDQGKVLKADLAALGLKGVAFTQLLCNGRRMTLARYPNADAEHPVTGGWAYVDGAPVPLYREAPGDTRKALKYRAADARTWAHPEEGEVMVFPRYNWWNNYLRITSVDREQHVLHLASDASFAIRPGDRYFFQGHREELDAPGEWYLDKVTSALYFIPPDGTDPRTMTVVVPVVRTILALRNTANLTIRGFTVECAEGTAITVNGSTDCRIAGCTVRNVGDYSGSGVVITGGHHNGVVGCDIHDVGSNCIALDGGDLQTLAPAENYADNNYVHHFGVIYKQGVGVMLNGVGNRVSHNLMHDGPRFGITWGGNDHVIEFNEIRHVDLETADCGAIYSWQVDWTKRGTEIRYNWLHDIVGFGQENGRWVSPHMNWGVYLDDGTCGVHVHHNVIARTILGGVHVHGGRDNVIENNILVDGRDHQMQYSGYVAGGHPVPMMTDTWRKFSGTPAYAKYPGYLELTRSLEFAWQMAGNKFLRNIVAWREPTADLYAYTNLPFDKTESDDNLIWHEGQPIRTGVQAVKELKGDNLAPNPGFEDVGGDNLPAGWQWQVRPNDSQAALDEQAPRAGQRSLRLEGRGTTKDSSGQTLVTNFVSGEIPLQPGHTYRLAVDVRAAAPTPVALTAQAYQPGKFWWGRSKQQTVGTEWKRVENTFRFPAPGDADYKEGLTSIRIRIDLSGNGMGTLWLDNVELREAVPMSEWEAWQALGLDTHSVIADPLFCDRAKDDYRLQPGSPALKLGFDPIPVERIGPYQDELRATWPIVQARGAREQMTLDWGKH